MRPPWRVFLDDDVYIGRGTELWAHETAEIRIGAHTLLGPGVLVTTLGHDPASLALPVTARAVTIGARCWIGARAIILPGVTIGEGCVVAAGAVVSHDMPGWKIVAGVPARVIKNRLLDEGPAPTS